MAEHILAPFDLAKAMADAGLQAQADRILETGLQGLQGEPGRVDRWVLQAPGGWRFDFTKQCLDGGVWDALKQVADAAEWRGRRDLRENARSRFRQNPGFWPGQEGCQIIIDCSRSV